MLFDVFLFGIAIVCTIVAALKGEMIAASIFFLALVLIYAFTTISDIVAIFEGSDEDEDDEEGYI